MHQNRARLFARAHCARSILRLHPVVCNTDDFNVTRTLTGTS